MLNKLKNLELNFTVSKAAMIVGVFTLASRLVGLLRDRLFASHFGAGDTLDIYYAAFRIPDFVFNLLILGTLSVAFIPVFTEQLLKDKAEANRTANTVLNLSFIAMSVICLALMFFAEPLTHLLVPGFSGQKYLDTVSLTRIFLLSPIIFTVSNLFTSVLNAQKKFLIANLAPIMYNLGIIFGLLVLYPVWGLKGLGAGVIVGALLHLVVQLPVAVSLGFSWQPVLDLKNAAAQKIIKLFLPRILGVDNSQISLLVGSIVGSILASGSIAVFNLANNLQAVPLGVFAIATAVAIFPLLSEFYAKRDVVNFTESLRASITQILFFMIPCGILLLLFRAHVVRLAFGAGKFDWDATILTFNTLGMFALSLFAQGLSPLLARAFYARQNTTVPVFTGLCTMALNAILAYLFGRQFGVAGMAAAFSIASIFNALVLFIIIRLRLKTELAAAEESAVIHNFDQNLLDSVFRIIVASIIMGLSGYGALYALAHFISTNTGIGLLLQAGLAGCFAIAMFFITADYLKIPQARKIIKTIF